MIVENERQNSKEVEGEPLTDEVALELAFKQAYNTGSPGPV